MSAAVPGPAALPAVVLRHPRLGQWLRVRPDGRIQACSGKVDIGQGISHALRLIVAAELGVDPSEVVMLPASTRSSPDEGVTSGSLSVQDSGAALRCAAASLRERARAEAARRLGLAPEEIVCQKGRYGTLDGRQMLLISELMAPHWWDEAIVPVPPRAAAPRVQADSPGLAPGRPDVAAKVFGQFEYIQDKVLPGMLRGQVFHPPVLGATLCEPAATELLVHLRELPGVERVVRDGALIGVLARTEATLGRAQQRVAKAQAEGPLWVAAGDLPAPADWTAWLQAQPLETTVVAGPPDAQAPDTPAPGDGIRLDALYERPFLQHASIGLCCALAQWSGGQAALEVWSHTQGIFNLQRDLALAFGLPDAAVGVHHVEGAGCYGHNGADDVAFDAAWLAQHADGRPVRVQWTRHAEMALAPLAPAMAVRIAVQVGADGRLRAWTQDVWSQGHGTRPGRGATPALLGAWQTDNAAPVPMAVNAPLAAGGGSERNAVPPYAVERLLVRNHRVLAMPVRVSAMRALGAHANVFAAESMVDEVARRLATDPLAFRLAHLRHPDQARAVAVLQAVAALARWRPAAERPQVEGLGFGIAYARYKNTGAYCAVVAEVEVTDAVALRQLWIAADLGQVVHPDGALNQIEGGALQAASWSVCEAARLGPGGVESSDWEQYPILRFSHMPRVQVQLVGPQDAPSLGAGECAAGPTAAAIANAIADATGVRVRRMPFTPDQLMRSALAQDD